MTVNLPVTDQLKLIAVIYRMSYIAEKTRRGIQYQYKMIESHKCVFKILFILETNEK